MGSQPVLAVAPQQELPPDFTRRAAWPYFSFTTSLMSVVSVLISEVLIEASPICRFGRSVRVLALCCECSTRHRGIEATPVERRCRRCSAGMFHPGALPQDLQFCAFRDGAREW